MPSVNTKSFSQLVTDFATSVQAKTSVLVDFAVGSVLRAVGESVAAAVVWLQGLILLLLQTTRASTSSGPDLESWLADYGFAKLPASFATGMVTFARFTATPQALVPIGALVQTSDGSIRFTVVIDTTNAAYSAAQGGYVIPAGTASLAIPVAAVAAGSASNVVAGAISVLAQAVPYVDTVSNAANFTSGSDVESDASARIRFVAYIASLSRATKAAIINAVISLKVGAACVLVENFQYNGTYQPGFFYAVVDDGSGTPGSTFLSSASNAIDAVRAFTVAFAVFGPIVVTANLALTVTVGAGYDPTSTKAAVRAALLAYVASLTLGQSLTYTRLLQVAYDASPGVVNVTGLTVNGGTADIAASNQQRVLSGTVVVS